jgi:hypothetical protein
VDLAALVGVCAHLRLATLRGGFDCPVLGQLVLAVAVNLWDGDLREPVILEVGQQVNAELPQVVQARVLAPLAFGGREPRCGELVK